MPDFDKDRCRARNRIAARRDAAEAVPVTFVDVDADLEVELASKGKLPKTDGEAMERINALLPSGAPALTRDQVHIHYVEAANDNFVGDRYLFLDPTTLRNIARDADLGVAFMNSHRTGGLSADAEQPFGKTFAGRYEEYKGVGGEMRKRALVGFYMLASVKPNGDSGPSTDDLHASIEGGTLGDVSVGLHGGSPVCDVCGNEMSTGWDDTACPHVPGTTYSMSDPEQNAQKKRGVPGGKCSYSLVEARMGELSGVYDGAVPGAGFRFAPLFNGSIPGAGYRKALAFAKLGRLDGADLSACRSAYTTLLARGEFETSPNSLTHVSLDLDTGRAPASFEEQLDQALVAVAGCIERADGYRNISAGRLAQADTLHAQLGEVLKRHRRPDEMRALSIRALRLRAAGLSLPIGSS